MPQRIFLYCVFLLCGAVWPVSGQTEYSFPSVSLEQGLSQPNVKALLSDERGFLWAGTVNGLNRFGNHSVRVYTRESEGASSLPDSRIEYLDEDREGRIWVLTRRGLARYRRDSDDFETLMDEPAWCAQMRSDGAWFGGDGCLYRMGYGPAASLERIPLFPTMEPRYRITAMTELPDSGLLLGTEDAGLYRFDPRKEQPLQIDQKEPDFSKFREFILAERRYANLVAIKGKEAADAMFQKTEEDAKKRWAALVKRAG